MTDLTDILDENADLSIKKGGVKKTSWKKGQSGNKSGLSKDAAAIKKMLEIQNEADGDPHKIMELMLKNFAVLGLKPMQVLGLADKLAPYIKPKLSSIDSTIKEDRQITVEFTTANTDLLETDLRADIKKLIDITDTE